MWETIPQKPMESKETVPFLAWMDDQVNNPVFAQRAKEALSAAEAKVPVLKALRSTPQSAPWHVEGFTLADHVERVLSGLFAIVDGADLLSIEELTRHKELKAEIQELQEIIREQAATLQAFALLHDLAKVEVLEFQAPEASLGAREGFFQHKHRSGAQATEAEIALYQKLLRAYQTKHPTLKISEVMGKFYDAYEIKIHHRGHAAYGASEEYLEVREAIGDMFRLREKDRVMLNFAIRNHIDVLEFFAKQPDVVKYELLVARATKAGLDADDALDLLLAAVFLDSAVGSMFYHDGVFGTDLRPVIHMLHSEEQVAPYRRARRIEEQARREKQKLSEVLAAAELSPEQVFELLNLPFGPERGVVMEKIYRLVRGQDEEINFGSQTVAITPRIDQAKKLFDQAKSS